MLLRVHQGLGRLLAQPGHDRDAAEAEHQERVVGVAHHAGQLLLQDAVEQRDHLVIVQRDDDHGHLPICPGAAERRTRPLPRDEAG